MSIILSLSLLDSPNIMMPLKMKKAIHFSLKFLLITLILSLNNCSDNPVEDKVRPGELNLIWLKGLRKVSDQTDFENLYQIQGVNFDLGDINGSTDFFFILANVGGTPITGISLTVADSSFSVYPKSIDILSPGDNIDLKELSEITFVRLTAIHGPAENRVGFTNLMPAGLNSTNLRISGTTIKENSLEQAVTLSAEMQVNAFLMDLRIWDGTREVDLLKSDGQILRGGFVIPGFVQKYDVTDTVRFENRGSVPVEVKVFRTNVVDTLEVGEIFLLGRYINTHIRFESNGTMRDRARFPVYGDGKTYIFLLWKEN